jgi:mono/diheme cytochrome c family protein
MFKSHCLVLLSSLAVFLAGCAKDTRQPSTTESPEAAAATEKGGAQLWAENCSRCHNVRSPRSFSDSQWQAITQHMRLRANLTGQETRAITEFLQSSD